MNMLLLFSRVIRLAPEVCLSLIKSAPFRYKVFSIPKRDREKRRIIAQPTPAIKALQTIAVREYLSKLPIHSAAMAYIKGVGIKTNALAHVENQYILKLDFSDFFHSILPNDIDTLNLNVVCGLSADEINLLKLLFFWSPNKDKGNMCLSIGAPSSPCLSNNIMYNFDSSINALCDKFGAKYTRYSDDITISINKKNELPTLYEEIKIICNKTKSPNLHLNLNKTVFASKKNRRSITGVIVTNDNNVSLGREKKRQIRAMIHGVIVGRVNDEENINKINGYLAFAKDIEPEFIQRLINSYSSHQELLADKGIFAFKLS